MTLRCYNVDKVAKNGVGKKRTTFCNITEGSIQRESINVKIIIVIFGDINASLLGTVL